MASFDGLQNVDKNDSATDDASTAPIQFAEFTETAPQLAEFTSGINAVQRAIRQETIGATNPRTQFLASSKILSDHRNGIGALTREVHTSNGGLLNVPDSATFVSAVVQNASLAQHMLVVAKPMETLPTEMSGRRDLSKKESHEFRLASPLHRRRARVGLAPD